MEVLFVLFFAFYSGVLNNSSVPWIGNALIGVVYSTFGGLILMWIPMVRYRVSKDGIENRRVYLPTVFIPWNSISSTEIYENRVLTLICVKLINGKFYWLPLILSHNNKFISSFRGHIDLHGTIE
jgi:hypothetical protein